MKSQLIAKVSITNTIASKERKTTFEFFIFEKGYLNL